MIRTKRFVSALAGGFLWANTAFADPSAADRATARGLAGEGYQALQDKDYATAVDRFSRADALVHAPTLMIDWARSLVGLGKLVEAQERYEQIIREGVDSKSPKSWQRAFTDSGAELDALKPRLAWVTISVSGSNEPRVTVDGAPVPPAAVGVRRAFNPGTRVVRAVAKGYLAQKKTIELAEGADQQVSFTLDPDPDKQNQSSTLLDTPATPNAPLQPRSPLPMYVAFGIGGAGLLVGGITGVLFLHKRSELAKDCSGHTCDPKWSSDVSAYNTLGYISGTGFVLGVAGAGAGAALWYFNRGAQASAEAPPPSGFVIHPYVGVACAGAVGSF